MSEDEIHKALYAHLDEAKHPALKMFDVDCVYDICRRLLASGQFISVKELQKILRECDEIAYAGQKWTHVKKRLDEMVKLPKSQEKIET